MVVVQPHPDGMLDLHEVQIGISDGSDEHTAATALLCIENTHNRCGGTVLSVTKTEELNELAHMNEVAVNKDGATVYNAAIALDKPVSTLVRKVDSLIVRVSKGLRA